MTSRISLPVAAAVASIFGLTAAQAGTIFVTNAGDTVSVSAESAAGAGVSPFQLYDPGTSSAAGYVSGDSVNMGGAIVTFSPNGTSPAGGTYAGTSANIAASPFSGTALTSTNYFVAEPSDPVTIAFTSPQTSFALLWGTVDSYNDLTFAFCSNGQCTTGAEVTGSDIASAAGINADGTTSAFVELSAPTAFDTIEITSTGIAFEFVPQAVPEPASIALLGIGLLGTGMMARRRLQVRPALTAG